eukprot:g5399.t1
MKFSEFVLPNESAKPEKDEKLVRLETTKIRCEIFSAGTLLFFIPLSRGIFPNLCGVEGLCGILSGYELVGLYDEIRGVNGRIRPLMFLHHTNVIVLVLVALSCYYTLPFEERQFWWFAWDAFVPMFDSTLILLIRNATTKSNPILNSAFALCFFRCRFYVQYQSFMKFTNVFESSPFDMPWNHWSTTFVYVMHVAFLCINTYWGALVLRMAMRTLSTKKKRA